MNNRSIEAEVCRLQNEIQRIKEQNKKIPSYRSYNSSESLVHSNTNQGSQILNQSNYKTPNVYKKDYKKNHVSYLSQQPSTARINYSSRGEKAFTQATKQHLHYTEFIRPPLKQGSFSYRKYLDGEASEAQRQRQHKNNLSILSQDIKLELIDGENDGNEYYNDFASQINTVFKNDSQQRSINLNKYKIWNINNIATANNNNNNNLNKNNSNGTNLFRNSSTTESNQYKQHINNNFNILMNNSDLSSVQNPNQGTNFNNVLSQFKIEQKGINNNDNNNISSPSLHQPRNREINSPLIKSGVTKCKSDNDNKCNKIINECSPIRGPNNHLLISPEFNYLNPLLSEKQQYENNNNNESTNTSSFKNAPRNEKESRRMIIEYIKQIKKPNENLPNLLSNRGINSKVMEQNTKNLPKQESPLIIGENYKHFNNNSISIPLLKGGSSLFNESKEKINVINFLSMPRILNLIINDETLVPCVFIMTPSESTITKGIETYLFKYKELQNNSFNCIEGCFDLSALISCTSSSISSLRIILCFYDDNDLNHINKYEIETPSIELRTYYLKGLNSILLKNKYRHHFIQ